MNERLGKSLARLESFIDFEKLASGAVPRTSAIDLERFRSALSERGDPQKKFPSVLIAGSKGKGSTAAFLESILRTAGYKTGLYTSPHLVEYNERIRVRGQCIGDDRFSEKLDELLEIAEKKGAEKNFRTVFEILTGTAFEVFARERIDIAVIEVGLGGRLDATNVLEPIATIITPIGLDHTEVLGDDLRSIALEKAGILRANVPLILGRQEPEAETAILERAAKIGASPIKMPGRDFFTKNERLSRDATCFEFIEGDFSIALCSALLGEFQMDNCAVAISAALELENRGFRIEMKDIERGVRTARWHGRFHRLQDEKGEIIVDGAHSPMSIRALIESVTRFWGIPMPIFIFAANRDKKIESMLAEIMPKTNTLILTTFDWPRAATVEELKFYVEKIHYEIPQTRLVEVICEESPVEAMNRARSIRSKDEYIVAAGSIYLAGKLLKAMGINPCGMNE